MKKELYKTAKSLVACAKFGAGEFVKIKFERTCECHNTNHYRILATESSGQLAENEQVIYPEHHLVRFCL